MLWGLDGNGIVDSGFRIGPKVGCHLEAGAERNEQAVCDVALGEAELLRPSAIDLYAQLRRVRHLVQSDIDRAGNLFHPRLDLACDCIIGLLGVTGDLDVDWRGQTEIQNLADDVCRLEIEAQLRKARRELLAHRLHIRRSRSTMPGFKRDKNLAVRGTDRGVITKGEVDALRYADIVDNRGKIARWHDFPDQVLNARKNLLAFLKPFTRGRIDVETELTSINRREKVAADDR